MTLRKPALVILAAVVLLLAGCGAEAARQSASASPLLVPVAGSESLPEWSGWFLTVSGRGLCAVRLDTGEQRVLNRDSSMWMQRSDRYLAWIPQPGLPHLHILDLATGKTWRTPDDVEVVGFGLDGHYLGWQQAIDSMSSTVLLTDLANNETTEIGRSSQWGDQPAVSGRWVAWQDDRLGMSYVYDTRTGIRTSLPNSQGGFPLLSNGWAAWSGAPGILSGRLPDAKPVKVGGGNTSNDGSYTAFDFPWIVHQPRSMDLVAFNLESHKRLRLDLDGRAVDALEVYGDWLVWRTWRGPRGLWARNLTTGESLRLSSGDVNYPCVHGDWLIWDDGINDGELSRYHAYNLTTGVRRDFQL